MEFQEKPVNYVTKAWGSELWLINQEAYCGKILTVNRGHQCSLHSHPIKEESFYVIKGFGLIQVESRIYKVLPQTVVHIQPNTLHRFATTGTSPMELLEISTHHEDDDVVRAYDSCPFTSEEHWLKDYYQLLEK
jgi:mannose-6-phosphate isomerase-like protein (cupin superfamily)